jgi:hypothetical protein
LSVRSDLPFVFGPYKGILERAMGIEPTSDTWEANTKNLKALELAARSVSGPGFNWKTNGK